MSIQTWVQSNKLVSKPLSELVEILEKKGNPEDFQDIARLLLRLSSSLSTRGREIKQSQDQQKHQVEAAKKERAKLNARKRSQEKWDSMSFSDIVKKKLRK